LQRFLALFVATSADVEPLVLETCVMAAVSVTLPTEIATMNFREFNFQALR
jgi:hypothetical protein